MWMNEVWSRFTNLLEERLLEWLDKRTGNNQFIKMKDIGLSAFFGIFYPVRVISGALTGDANAGRTESRPFID